MSTNQQDSRLDDSGESKSEEMLLAEEQILLCKERMLMREIQNRLTQQVKQLVVYCKTPAKYKEELNTDLIIGTVLTTLGIAAVAGGVYYLLH